MNLKSQIGIRLINSLPETIADQLLKNKELVSFTNLGGVLHYSGLGAFDHEQVLAVLLNNRNHYKY